MNYQTSKNSHEFKNILSQVEKFRLRDRSATGMIFTDNWYDSHPRLLIFDPILTPYDKLIWMTIRAFCSPDMSLAAFPSYDDIQANLHVSRATVSSSIAKLRVTRWITLLCRDRVRNESGQFVKDGNIYLVHGEPLAISDTIELDAGYMGFLNECKSHRNTDTRKISEMILSSIGSEIRQGNDILEDRHPFEQRLNSWNRVREHAATRRTEEESFTADMDTIEDHSQADLTSKHLDSSAVYEVNHGAEKAAVQKMNYGESEMNCRSYSSSSGGSIGMKNGRSENKKKTTNYNNFETKQTINELIYPSSLSDNQKRLIGLHLERLPENLPPSPAPWTSWQQLLLDELEGRIRVGQRDQCPPVWNPVSLLSAYCRRLIENGMGLKSDEQFQIDFADGIYEARITASKNERVSERAAQDHKKKMMERLRITREMSGSQNKEN